MKTILTGLAFLAIALGQDGHSGKLPGLFDSDPIHYENKPIHVTSPVAASSVFVGTVGAVTSNTSETFVIYDAIKGQNILSINRKNGSVTFGPGVTPSEAARQFADALKVIWPTVCTNVGAQP